MWSRLLLALLLLGVLPACVHAQASDSALSDAEVEKLRDTAYVAHDRVLAFIEFLDDRTKAMQKVMEGPRRQGRERDLHDLMEQFTSIANELEDNLDEYGPSHRDIRKALPKLIAATDRWATIIRSPAEDNAYNVSRKLALETLEDLRDESSKMLEEQKTWFAAHPPAKNAQGSAMLVPR